MLVSPPPFRFGNLALDVSSATCFAASALRIPNFICLLKRTSFHLTITRQRYNAFVVIILLCYVTPLFPCVIGNTFYCVTDDTLVLHSFLIDCINCHLFFWRCWLFSSIGWKVCLYFFVAVGEIVVASYPSLWYQQKVSYHRLRRNTRAQFF